MNLYSRASLFVQPSVVEVFDSFIEEAMAAGLPVICSENIRASDIVKNYIHGFVIAAANSDILADKVLWCYNNQEVLLSMGSQSNKIITALSWSNYGNQIIDIYNKILKA